MATDPILLTTKRTALLGDLPLTSGPILREVTLGYETYGRLNPGRSNVVLVCHHFSGSSHAAGRYHVDDREPGWWDAIIGPGKVIDTERYFVLAVDALGCLRKDRPHGVTTSTMSSDPVTGRPYGPQLPPLAVSDSVRAQRRLLDHLGIGRLHAVMGPSFGGMQALEWAVRYPEAVERAMIAVSLAEFQARELGLYKIMQDAVALDPKFRGGHYDPQDPPLAGLRIAAELMTVLGCGREAMRQRPGRAWADPEADPGLSNEGRWAMEPWLEAAAQAKLDTCDANAWLAMLRTNMRWDLAAAHGSLEAAMARVRARVLLLPGGGDELVHGPSYHAPLAQAMEHAGVDVRTQVLPSEHGHVAGLSDIHLASEAIRAWLAPLEARLAG